MNLVRAKVLSIAGGIFLLALSPMATCASGADSMTQTSAVQEVSLKVGEQFLRARARIIKQGWKPIPMHQNDGYERSGTDRLLAERKVFEVDSCSVDAGVLCTFYYKKMAKCLRVDTVGENVAQITVTRWTEECPDKWLGLR
jgi:hypothetical protein